MSKDIQELETAEDFFAVLSLWHQQQVDTIEHMMEIPSGTDVTIEGQEVNTLKLEGDALRGFKFGLATALSLLGNLPFTAVDEDDAEPAPEQG